MTTLRLPGFLPPRIEAVPAIGPFLKWPGGKSQELPAIAAAAPSLIGRLIDPFVGGGSILFATPVEVPALVNDASPDLIGLYTGAASQDPAFRSAVLGIARAWDGLASLHALYDGLVHAFERDAPAEAAATLARFEGDVRACLDPAGPALSDLFMGRVGRDVVAKFARMRKVEVRVGRRLSPEDLLANIEGAVRSSLYMSVRSRYNAARLAGHRNTHRLADFFLIREFAYAAMFRFNAHDEFNVPYGGVSYNQKSLAGKANQLFSPALLARLASTEFRCLDFEPFLADARLTPTDFVFVDPPYDTDFSAYDNRSFDTADQRRLEAVLAEVPSRVMVVIKDTPGIRGLYDPNRWRIAKADKTYAWTIKSRNDRAATHLTITNYEPDRA